MDCYYDDYPIYDLICEMESWMKIDEEVKTLAKKSDITKWNNKTFRDLLFDWQSGVYEDDIDVLYKRVKELL